MASPAPPRGGIRWEGFAVGAVIAVVAIAAALYIDSSYVGGAGATPTGTTTCFVSGSVSYALPPGQTSCVLPTTASSSTQASSVTNATTDVRLGLTLTISADPVVVAGGNQTVSAALTNDAAQARVVNYTGYETLRNGFNPATPEAIDYVLPAVTGCSAPPGYASVFVALLDGSGNVIQLNDVSPVLVSCVSGSAENSYSFKPSQVVSLNFSFGGYWSSPNAGQPWIDAAYHGLAPGSYTVVVFDGWNQIAELNFVVAGS